MSQCATIHPSLADLSADGLGICAFVGSDPLLDTVDKRRGNQLSVYEIISHVSF